MRLNPSARCQPCSDRIGKPVAMTENDTRLKPNGQSDPFTRALRGLDADGSALPAAALHLLAREVLQRMTEARHPTPKSSDWPDAASVAALADALMGSHDTAASDLVDAARIGGADVEALYHHYIAGAVRLLGERWEREEASVSQVVIGSGRVYVILRALRPIYATARMKYAGEVMAAFALVPGEQHSLGVVMAADHFRRHGWAIDLKVGMDHDALVEAITAGHYPIVGLSANRLEAVLPLTRLIVALRVRNPGIWIMIAGLACNQNPDLGDLVDADAMISDLDEAERLMTGVLQSLKAHQLPGRQ
jgi:MerR family transcriptional regulator, light-induced transcriptional regulator